MPTRKRAPDLFDIRVSKEQFARASAIFEALRAALNDHGFTVVAVPRHDRRCTFAEKDGVGVALQIHEKSSQRRTTDRWGTKVELVHNGRLALRLGWDPSNLGEPFRDGLRKKLENQIDTMVARCIQTHADTLAARRRREEYQARAAAEEQERKRIEDERQQAQARREELLRLAHSWQDSHLLRAFADEFERLAEGRLTDDGREWLSVARREADAMDPLRLHRQHE